MSIITEVERIQQAKQDLKNKLLEKGVDVGDKKIDEYAPMLDEIQSGVDTSDATATANDIRVGATAYVNDEKVTGIIEDYNGTFEGNGETQINALKKLLDYTKNASYLFYHRSNIKDLTGYISYYDTSNVTSMSNMFNYCSSLTTIPPLDTSKVTNMTFMFSNCTSLTTIDISHYNISSTSNSNYWCCDCYSLKSLIIRSFGTKYLLNGNAFNYCYHLLGTVNETYNPNGDKDCYIYIPKNMVSTLSSATNWSTYADQFRALEDYTVDGTTTGELDESKVNT